MFKLNICMKNASLEQQLRQQLLKLIYKKSSDPTMHKGTLPWADENKSNRPPIYIDSSPGAAD